MKLKILSRNSSTIAGESVPLDCELTTGSAGLNLPHDHDGSEALYLELLDAELAVVSRADGLTRKFRQSPLGARLAPPPAGSVALDPGETVVWSADLLSYFDPPGPGRHFIRATFEPPGRESVASTPLPLDVIPNNGVWMDALLDSASMPIVFVLSQHEGAEGTRWLYQLDVGLRPELFWAGGVLDLPGGARPRVAEVDFSALGNWDHDLERWGVWLEGDRIHGVRFGIGVADPKVISGALGDSSLELLGRPVEHADSGLSVVAMREVGGRWELLRLAFDPHLAARSKTPLASLDACPTPCHSAADSDENLYIAIASGGAPPVGLISVESGEVSHERELLTGADIAGEGVEPKDVQILEVVVRAKGDGAGEGVVVVVALVHEEIDRWLSIVETPLGVPRSPARTLRTWRVDLEDNWMPRSEQPSWAGVGRDANRQPILVLATTSGRLLHLDVTGDVREVSGTEATRIDQAQVVCLGGAVYLLHPTAERGTVCTVLAPPPPAR